MGNKVSVVMPNYNGAKFISQSIESVINQTYPDWELIIIDDFSSDDSIEVIKSYEKIDVRIQLHKLNQNAGHPSVVRNYGIYIASGRFIAFLDSDDIWFPKKLEQQVNFMNENQIDFAYSGYQCITEDGKIIKRQIIPPASLSYTKLLKHCRIGCLTAIYDCKKLGKFYFVPHAGQEDFIYWLEILKKSKIAHGIPNVLGSYRLRKSSVSSNKLKMAKYNWKVYYSFEKLGFFKSCFYFSSNIFYWINARLNF